MNSNDRKIRLYGMIAFATIFFLFWHLIIFAYSQTPIWGLLVRAVLSAVIFSVTTWEPTRFFIMLTHRKWPEQHQNIRRKLVLAALLIPSTILFTIGRTLLENWLFWKMPYTDWSFMLPMFGVTTLFVLVEVAIYESWFFVLAWAKSKAELEELKKTNLQIQYDTLKLQIQPHFLFNTLNTLVGLIELDPRRARVFTEEMAYVYRYLLSSNETQFVDLQDEIKFTKAYYYLLKTRHPEGLNMEVVYPEDTENLCFHIPPLTLQILLENAVKHNVVTRARPLAVTVIIDSDSGQVTVCNNLQRKDDIQRNGMGLQHLHKRFGLLGMPPVVVREDSTCFSVKVPLIKTTKYESVDH